MEYITLANGYQLPLLGYGTLHIPPKQTKECVLKAFEAGYRLIDTAASYQNEKEIGEAIKESKLKREEIYLTTKVWVQDAGYENTLQAFHQSLENLGVDYLDLYLIHQPYGDYYGSWKAMEELYQQGKIKAIGVCNFSPERFIDLYMNSLIHIVKDCCFIAIIINLLTISKINKRIWCSFWWHKSIKNHIRIFFF